MALTLACSGMDAGSEKELHTTFALANGRLDGAWSLVPESEADHVVVDMDSIYGPMSWIRLHAAGKYVIGLTTAPRTRTNFHLERPITIDGLVRLLGDIARAQGVDVADSQAHRPATPLQPAPSQQPAGAHVVEGTGVVDHDGAGTAAEIPAPDIALPEGVGDAAVFNVAVSAPVRETAAESLSPAPPHGDTPAPAPMDQLPKEDTFAPDEESMAPADPVPAPAVPVAHETPPVAADGAQATRRSAPDQAPQAAAERPPAVQVAATPAAQATPAATNGAAHERRHALAYWIAAGNLAGLKRLRSSRAPTLYLDADARTYHGPQTLKPVAGAFEGALQAEEFETVDSQTWTRETAELGPAQPIARLQWFAAFLAGKGKLLPGNDASGHYRLLRWPQTEREFPKHFRIATAMMKGPASLDEIAQASSVSVEDVADFVNASLFTGHAEYVWPTKPEPAASGKGGGLFGRLRGSR